MPLGRCAEWKGEGRCPLTKRYQIGRGEGRYGGFGQHDCTRMPGRREEGGFRIGRKSDARITGTLSCILPLITPLLRMRGEEEGEREQKKKERKEENVIRGPLSPSRCTLRLRGSAGAGMERERKKRLRKRGGYGKPAPSV